MDNINDIISSLSDDDIEMLKGVASSILGDGNANEQKSAESDKKSVLPNGLNLSQSDLNMMLKAKTIIDKMNNTSSKDADLILALKPHLSEESRAKADKAIRILKLFDILPYIKELF
ncbi:hypothetical protein [uncultured Eubacterium sp.]|uniref:hypothetical protein n=1 Tax=uncultured Eubacterium sp. TaxID=165185 RepID=UPI0025D30F6E|nr:hypothetical protein [uncultured Eubacterium sp.]